MLNLSATDRDDSWFAIIQTKARTCFSGAICSLPLLVIGIRPVFITSRQSCSNDPRESLKWLWNSPREYMFTVASKYPATLLRFRRIKQQAAPKIGKSSSSSKKSSKTSESSNSWRSNTSSAMMVGENVREWERHCPTINFGRRSIYLGQSHWSLTGRSGIMESTPNISIIKHSDVHICIYCELLICSSLLTLMKRLPLWSKILINWWLHLLASMPEDTVNKIGHFRVAPVSASKQDYVWSYWYVNFLISLFSCK